jgi:hypothetical protein
VQDLAPLDRNPIRPAGRAECGLAESATQFVPSRIL